MKMLTLPDGIRLMLLHCLALLPWTTAAAWKAPANRVCVTCAEDSIMLPNSFTHVNCTHKSFVASMSSLRRSVSCSLPPAGDKPRALHWMRRSFRRIGFSILSTSVEFILRQARKQAGQAPEAGSTFAIRIPGTAITHAAINEHSNYNRGSGRASACAKRPRAATTWQGKH